MKKYQVIYFKNPTIKRGKKIVKNKECQHRNKDIDKETEMGMQYMIFSKDEKCLLNKHRNHQGKRIIHKTEPWRRFSITSPIPPKSTPKGRAEVDWWQSHQSGAPPRNQTLYLSFRLGFACPPHRSGGSSRHLNHTQKGHTVWYVLFVVGRGGFEPPKSKTSDLQSDPFGRSGICPY